MDTIFMNFKNSKASEALGLLLDFSNKIKVMKSDK